MGFSYNTFFYRKKVFKKPPRTPAPVFRNQGYLKPEREPDKTRSRVALRVVDRFVLTFWFFFVKEKGHVKYFNEI